MCPPQVISEIQTLQASLDSLVAEHREEEFMMEKSIEVKHSEYKLNKSVRE